MTTPITPEQARELAIDLSFSNAAVALRSLADQVEALTAELARPETLEVSILRAERDAAVKLAADRMVDADRWMVIATKAIQHGNSQNFGVSSWQRMVSEFSAAEAAS